MCLQYYIYIREKNDHFVQNIQFFAKGQTQTEKKTIS